MKSRKREGFNELIAEVTKHLQNSFMPDPKMIKQQIESLIDREYLKRDANDSKQFEYTS
jgi:cullin 3